MPLVFLPILKVYQIWSFYNLKDKTIKYVPTGAFWAFSVGIFCATLCSKYRISPGRQMNGLDFCILLDYFQDFRREQRKGVEY